MSTDVAFAWRAVTVLPVLFTGRWILWILFSAPQICSWSLRHMEYLSGREVDTQQGYSKEEACMVLYTILQDHPPCPPEHPHVQCLLLPCGPDTGCCPWSWIPHLTTSTHSSSVRRTISKREWLTHFNRVEGSGVSKRWPGWTVPLQRSCLKAFPISQHPLEACCTFTFFILSFRLLWRSERLKR